MGTTVTTLLDGCTFLEAARWHEDRIWFSELYTHQVMSAEEDGSDVRVEATIPGEPAGIDWLPDGRLVVAVREEQKVVRREHDGTVVVHADLSKDATGFCNEVVVDKQGRCYVGSFGFDLDDRGPMATSSLHRVDLDGTITEVADDLWFPNGSVITGEDVLIVNETFGNRVTAFDLTEDGRLVNRRAWAEFGPLPKATTLADATPEFVVSPDGMCLDAEGMLWIADLTSRTMLRVREGGEVVDEVDPGVMPFSAVLGGSDGQSMFICAAPYFDDVERDGRRLSQLLKVRVTVPAP